MVRMVHLCWCFGGTEVRVRCKPTSTGLFFDCFSGIKLGSFIMLNWNTVSPSLIDSFLLLLFGGTNYDSSSVIDSWPTVGV